MIQGLAFYVFSLVAIAAAVMVISARNPVHSVLFLILVFFSAAALFVLMGAEFLAMILVVVYVGAVAVLFLFVVMMLDINFAELREGFLRYLPVGLLIGIVLLVELVVVVASWKASPDAAKALAAPTPSIQAVPNTHAIGKVLYTDYAYLFQASGIILLIAMIGAIVLTLRERTGVKRQVIARQNARRRDQAVAVRKVQTGSGA